MDFDKLLDLGDGITYTCVCCDDEDNDLPPVILP